MKLSKEKRASRIIARGEHSGHSHVITGDAEVTRNSKGEILIEVGDEGAILRHLIESEWMNGVERHTNEHGDIDLKELPSQVRQGDVFLEKIGERQYKFIQQIEYNPLDEVIQQVQD